MKILLTGGTGFLGEKLLTELTKNKNLEIFSVERSPSKRKKLYKVIEVNDLMKEEIEKINPDVVIHLASFLTSKDDLKTANQLIDSNISYGVKLLDSLKDTKIKYFINTGTSAEYHYNDEELSPTYLYAATKSAFRNIISYYAKLINFKTFHVIPHTIYGEPNKNKKILDLLIDSADSKEKIQLSSGEQIFDFIHINDVVDFYCNLIDKIEKAEDNEVYYLGTGKGHSIKELSQIVSRIIGKNLNIKWGVNNRKIDTISNIAPIANTISTFNWKTTIDLEEGVQQYINKIIKK